MTRLRSRISNGIYRIIVLLVYVVMKVLFRFRIEGRANMEENGRYIVVARHRSYWDVFLMAAAVGSRNRIHFIARRGLMKYNVLVQPVIRAYSTIIDRENFGRADFRRMLEAVKRERLVGIFPEGTTRGHVTARAGAIRFAALTKKHLLPVNIRCAGPYPPKYPFGLPKIIVSIGQPFSVDGLGAGEDSATSRPEIYRQMSEQLMQRVDSA